MEQVSISTIGEALVALDREESSLAAEMERLAQRFRHIAEKRRIIHEATTRLLKQVGVEVREKQHQSFPELSHRG